MRGASHPIVDQDAVLECARRLVREPSENPPGNESAVAAVAEHLCKEAGLSVERIEPAPGRVNLLATLDSGNSGRTLVFNGHLDVVPIVDESLWAHPPFEAHVTQGLLHGRGSADMKGAIGAAIAAAHALKDVDFNGKLVLQLVADEEVFGPLGTLTLREKGLLDADAAVVGEPTSLRVGIAQRGLFWTKITTHGTAAHGSIPDRGVSAIEAAAKAVLALRGMQFDRKHPLLGTPTINVGTIRGGGKINIVPALCEIDVDERVMPGDDPEFLRAELEAEIARVVEPAEATIEVTNYADGYEISASQPIVKLAIDAHRAVRGDDAECVGMMGATDAAIINGAGTPAIVFGPGSLGLAHTTNEHVEVGELVDAAKMYAWMAHRFLSE